MFRQLAKKLQDALEQHSALDCSVARAQIPQLVAAQRAGVDADAMTQFRPLLRHFDTCSNCTEAYNRQSQAANQ